jgi:hypothetical protein
MFYDGPVPPKGIFEDFLAIPEIPVNVGTSSFLKFLDNMPASDPLVNRSVVPGPHLYRET